MLFTIIAIVLFVVLSGLFWKSKEPSQKVALPRRRKKSLREPGPWETSDNERRGAR